MICVRTIVNAANKATPCHSACFVARTLILCQDEEGNECHKPIEKIEIGDNVWAYDEETGENDWKPVVRLFRNETIAWYHIFAAGQEIICTPNHPFYVIGKGFVEAKDLKSCEILLQSDGTNAIIEAIEVEQLDKLETTYNFEVSDFHTYYVTNSSILVHNFCEKKNADYYVKYKHKGEIKAYHQKSGKYKGKFIAKDDTGHGGSSYKLLKEIGGSKLKLIGDLDEYGIEMLRKHSSNVERIYDYFGRTNL